LGFLVSYLLSISASFAFCSLSFAVSCFNLAVSFSISTVPLNAEISQCSQEGCHSESVAPELGLGDDAEESEVLFAIEAQKCNSDYEYRDQAAGQQSQKVDPHLTLE
jgi:hypothetical protein